MASKKRGVRVRFSKIIELFSRAIYLFEPLSAILINDLLPNIKQREDLKSFFMSNLDFSMILNLFYSIFS